MQNASAHQNAGKGISLPKSKSTANGQTVESIEVGDLVEVTFDSRLAQVIAIDNQADVIAPLLDLASGVRFKPSERSVVHRQGLLKIPPPVIEPNWRPLRPQLPDDQASSLRSFVNEAAQQQQPAGEPLPTEPCEVVDDGKANAAEALSNVLAFVAAVKTLQRRAWLYTTDGYAAATEQEIMRPFDAVIHRRGARGPHPCHAGRSHPSEPAGTRHRTTPWQRTPHRPDDR